MTTLFLHFSLFLITTCVTKLIPVVHSHCIEDQQLSLLHFKNSLVFDSSDSSKLITWNSSTDCCSWVGVTCSTNGHVVDLDISSESISCNIDNSSSLFQLQHLQRLNLAHNDFNDSQIPSAIGKLTNLRYLNLRFTSFNGQIPIEISRLTRLAILDLSGNFGGVAAKNTNLSILFQNLTELTELNLNGVNLSAQAPHWCQAISSSLLNLTVLSLSYCDLSGPICESLAKLQSLSEIYLDDNAFYAPVPRLFANFSKLTALSLSNCHLQGTFPKEIFQIPCLQTIDISFNDELGGSFPEYPKHGSLQSIDVSVTNFSGILPNSIGNLKMLSSISLLSCSFTGSVPKSIANLTQLVELDMSWNRFNGPISAIHWESLVNLESLRLSNNLLKGGISVIRWESLVNLKSLDLSGNLLKGGISAIHWESLVNLESLYLSNNQLNGRIPSSIFSLPLLRELVLSYNLFSGQVPEFSNTSSPLLSDLDLGNNNLEGQIPTSIFNLQGLMDLNLHSNYFTGFPFNGPQQPRNLSRLDLSDNSLLDYNGTGSSFLQIGSLLLASNKLRAFPDFLKNQSILSELDLSANQIHGQIPNWIWRLNSLEKLNLSYNSFSTVEAHLPNSTSTLVSLDLHSNKIQGIHSSYSFLQLNTLVLASNKLRSFPDFLRNQSTLWILDLSNNQIQGQIPNWIWSLNSFQGLELNLSCNSLETLEAPLLNSTFFVTVLDLHSNQLQGQIPMFVNGPYLDYSRNNFSSSIPTDIGDFISARTYLSLSSNNLHGAIPKSICNASGLVLDLSNNSLSGVIPRCLTNLIPIRQAKPLSLHDFYSGEKPLSVLDLSRNNLTGTIPDNFLEDCELHTLDLSINQIQGQFPKSLVNCSRLEVLNLGNNQIIDTFPCLLMSISTLRVLVLRFNKFHGSIECPKTNGTWPVLQIIDLAHNNLSGQIPGRKSLTWQAMVANEDDSSTNLGFSYGPSIHEGDFDGFGVYYRDAITTIIKGLELDLVKILTIFTLIDFSFNNFNGSIPEEMGQLKSLCVLNLSGNALTGKIPSSFGSMRQLESLDLSQNHLSGQIPPQFANLTFLAFLNVSNNQLTGRIPTITQFSTFPNTSFEGNKGLWGPPLTADTVALLPPPMLNGNLSNPKSGDEIDWDIISVEIGFTCGFGIAVGSLMFCKRWRKWYYRSMCNILFKIFPQLEQRFGNHRRHVYVNTRWRH